MMSRTTVLSGREGFDPKGFATVVVVSRGAIHKQVAVHFRAKTTRRLLSLNAQAGTLAISVGGNIDLRIVTKSDRFSIPLL